MSADTKAFWRDPWHVGAIPMLAMLVGFSVYVVAVSGLDVVALVPLPAAALLVTWLIDEWRGSA